MVMNNMPAFAQSTTATKSSFSNVFGQQITQASERTEGLTGRDAMNPLINTQTNTADATKAIIRGRELGSEVG